MLNTVSLSDHCPVLPDIWYSEKLRYTVYEGNKMYLLNTDYDLPITVKIIYGENEKIVTLDSLEMKTVQL